MKILLSNDNIYLDKSVVTIGTFDGVHRGHQKVIKFSLQIARKNAYHSVIYTFFPHPRKVISKSEFKNINTQAEKFYLLNKLGVEYVFIQEFTSEFAQKDAQQFIEEHLLKQLSLKELVIGYDHQFGKNRQGNYYLLQELSKKYNFNLHRVDALYNNDITISSTKIRKALENGNLSYANELLGYPFLYMAKVVEGLKIGKKLGFPTANLDINENEKIIPNKGVYAVFVEIDGVFYKGVLSIGYRPTLNLPVQQLAIEAHLIDFSGDLYDKIVTVFFMERIRDDIKFENIEQLKLQINADIKSAKELFAKNPHWDIIQNNLFLFNK